jgi:hypothetical protein
MSQHDFDIANQTAPNTRVDLNLALKALASTSSGTSAPATTYANMLYYNTTDNKLYKRNEADSGWISLGVVNETDGVFYPSGVTIATQAEAEAGTNNTKFMSPLRVRNALNATGSAPTYACRAWVNFNGTTGVIRASGNVSSVTVNGTADYTVNFSTAMPDANYAVSSYVSNSGGSNGIVQGTSQTASSLRFQTRTTNTRDLNIALDTICVSIFR